MGVNDPNCASIIVKRWDPVQAEAGLNDLVDDDFSIFHSDFACVIACY
jgi:hypothetical protein